MEVYALIGESGTGKSYKSLLLAYEYKIDYILDDGLLIRRNKIIAGKSAKNEPNKFKAVKRAIFFEKNHREEVKEAIRKYNVKKILILATSSKMLDRIVYNLGLPKPVKVIRIEEISDPDEIYLAKRERHKEGKHAIPIPRIQIEKDFPGNLVESLEVIYKSIYKIGERTIVRPPFSFFGKLFISERAIFSLIDYILKDIDGVYEIRSKRVRFGEVGLKEIRLEMIFYYDVNISSLVSEIQKKIYNTFTEYIGIPVEKVNIKVLDLIERSEEVTKNG